MKLAVVYPFANLDSVPLLVNAITSLAEAGDHVDVWTRKDAEHVPASFDNENVTMILRRERRERRGLGRWLPAKYYYPLAAMVRHGRRRYDAVMAVDPQGLIEARTLFGRLGVPISYCCLEVLVLNANASERQRRWKQAEVEMAATAPVVIVPSAERLALLRSSTGLELPQGIVLPNAPPGPARRRPRRYWHSRFGLQDKERIVLHAGNLDEWTGIDEIVASTSSWPEGFRLVVHTRRAASEDDPRVRELRGLGDPKRVHFSLQPVSADEYDDLVDSADVGIVFYDPDFRGGGEVDEKIAQTGLASGKLTHYLRAALPVVVNTKTGLGRNVRDWGCGVAVAGGGEIGAALTAISQERKEMSRRSAAAFDEHIDFQDALEKIRKELEPRQ